ncbi:MAG: hypothetical protein ACJ8GN_09650 [Longimicrobiaceae bacterium]
MTRHPILAVAVAVLLGACANPREEARGELRKLRTALDEHRARYGRYPETVDARRPASAANLPLQPREGVSVELVHAGAGGIQALARRRPWICTMNVDARGAERLACATLTNTDAPPAQPGGASPLDSMLHAPSSAGAKP